MTFREPRAGDAGKGFAVVAENVRKLSDQSKNSAEEISHVVDTISSTLQELFDEINVLMFKGRGKLLLY